MKRSVIAAVTVLCATTAAGVLAQVQTIYIKKGYGYIQSGPSTIAIDPATNNYFFHAHVIGQNIGGITAPVLSGPVNQSMYCCWNNGRLTYDNDPTEPMWRMGSNASDFGVASRSILDAAFANGLYTFVVNGVNLPLNLAGNVYPPAPVVTFTGGAWANGKYVVDPALPFTVTTSAYVGYGSHVDDAIVMPLGATQFASAVPGSNTASTTIPANFLVAGNEYDGGIEFIAIVDKRTDPGLPGAIAYAGYGTRTSFTIKTVTPPFPMTTNVSIGPTVSNATANIQFRAQDVGTTGSVYSFFVAPSTKVLNAKSEKGAWLGHLPKDAKDASVQCVIAQLNSSGQLQAVSAANLQAYVTGVLSGQGQAITMLNNTLTANIAGAALYVGYGKDALNMLTAGLNRRAATIPGSVQCDPEAPQMGWWWNPAEGGRGYSIEVAGSHIFWASYLYDASGRATWYVASGNTSLDGSLFTGNLEAYSGGQTLSSAYHAPTPAVLSGPITLAFNNAKQGTMTWPGGSVPIQRFNIVPNGVDSAPGANQPEGGWWFNPSFFLEWQGGELFMAGYMYDDNGNPIWYLSSNTQPSTNLMSYTNTWWQYAGGQTLTGAFKPATQVSNNVGPVSIQFQDSANAIMTLPGGRTTNIRRFRF
jgi:hypothetical protein